MRQTYSQAIVFTNYLRHDKVMKQNIPSIRQPEHPVLFGAIGFIFASLLVAVIIIAVFFPLGLFGIAPPEGLRKYMIVILIAPLAEEIIRYKILADAPDPMKARYSPWRLAVLMAAGWIIPSPDDYDP
jgi:hypothetical protein